MDMKLQHHAWRQPPMHWRPARHVAHASQPTLTAVPRPILLRVTAIRCCAAAVLIASISAAPLAAQPGSACAAAEHRQFDFWVGSWTVTDTTGGVLGTNEIRPAANGCALLEQWQGAAGVTGISTSFFEPATGRWNQLWVGGGGVILRLEGELRDGVMQLTGTGERATPDGAVRDRIRWQPLPDGSVEQVWLISRDGGESWAGIFRGRYRKRPEPDGRRLR
jgi:hypothetical protein